MTAVAKTAMTEILLSSTRSEVGAGFMLTFTLFVFYNIGNEIKFINLNVFSSFSSMYSCFNDCRTMFYC